MNVQNLKDLEQIAKEIRRLTIKKAIKTGTGHIASGLSVCVNKEILDHCPDVSYKMYANNNLPHIMPSTSYPLRYKLAGYY